MRRPRGALAWAELALALLITALIVSLNVRFSIAAGPLWRAGHRVWLVGSLLFPDDDELPPVLPPAPGLPTGWSDEPYEIGWAPKTGGFVQTHAERLVVVGIPLDRPVSSLENASLLVAEGWRNTPRRPDAYSPR